MFSEIAILWTKISTLFEKTAETKNIKYINQASEILVNLSKKEKIAMELLLGIQGIFKICPNQHKIKKGVILWEGKPTYEEF